MSMSKLRKLKLRVYKDKPNSSLFIFKINQSTMSNSKKIIKSMLNEKLKQRDVRDIKHAVIDWIIKNNIHIHTKKVDIHDMREILEFIQIQNAV